MKKTLCVAALLLAATFVAEPSYAQTTLNSDAAFLAWQTTSGFNQAFGGDVRWGDSSGAAEWEYGVVRPDGSTLAQGQLGWTPTAIRPFSFSYLPAHYASMTVDGSSTGSVSVSSLVTDPVNTLLIRVAEKLDPGGTAILADYQVVLAGGDVLGASSLVGDEDAQYHLYQDARLADGFSVANQSSGGIYFYAPDGTHRSRLAVNFKVGATPVSVPEPASALLLATGLLGIGLVRRRRGDRVGITG